MAWYTEPARPAWEQYRHTVPSEWRRVENDDANGIYITGLDALNLPTGPLGDWHGTTWRPISGSGATTRTPANERLCKLGTELWERSGLADAREALRGIGHPRGADQAPVWVATHARAVAELVMCSLIDSGAVSEPDARSARRWLDATGRDRCARMLESAKPSLTCTQQPRLDQWVTALRTATGLRNTKGDE